MNSTIHYLENNLTLTPVAKMKLCEHNKREHAAELTLLNVKTKMYNTHRVQEYSIPIFAIKYFFFF